ncbi:MAG: hypothetical protein HZA78_01020 [Candidatus Schekmanbacteria bacterium]|nr:hypothetical protein [Candidatus Schekmanbacteria bacterium]
MRGNKANLKTATDTEILPKFSSLDEMLNFVDTHDLSPYLDQMPEEHFEVDIKARRYLFVLDGKLADRLTEIAKSRNISTEKLINSLLKEKIEAK